jgi:hypothetical protein
MQPRNSSQGAKPSLHISPRRRFVVEAALYGNVI